MWKITNLIDDPKETLVKIIDDQRLELREKYDRIKTLEFRNDRLEKENQRMQKYINSLSPTK